MNRSESKYFATAEKMDEAYTAMNRHIFFPILERFHVPSEDREYMMTYFMHGLVAIISDWLMGDCKDSTEQIIRVMQRCTLRPMSYAEGAKE